MWGSLLYIIYVFCLLHCLVVVKNVISCSIVHILSIFRGCSAGWTDDVFANCILFSISSGGRQEMWHICLWTVCEHTAISPQNELKLCKLFTNASLQTMFAGVYAP
jgi:hypothetical protein